MIEPVRHSGEQSGEDQPNGILPNEGQPNGNLPNKGQPGEWQPNEWQPQPKGQKRSALIAIVALVIVVAVAVVGYGALSSSQSGASSSASQYAVAQGSSSSAAQSGASSDAEAASEAQKALACQILTFEGEETTLERISDGKPVIINVWATWCPYCVAEMQYYQRLYDSYGDRLQFVMLNACDSANEVSLSRDYIAENGFTFPVYYDADFQVQFFFNVRAYPTTIILSDGGYVLLNRPGQISYESMDATLATLVGV